MPSGFMPNGTVVNHWAAGSFASQKSPAAWNASILPWDAASKQSKGSMICPSGNTSILNRPPLISSTTFARRSAAPWYTSSAAGQAVDMRHWIFGCAMTLGASTMAAAAAATTPPAVAMNLRRWVIRPSSSANDEVAVRAFRDVVPRPHQRLELRERGVHLAGHGRFFRFLPDHVAGHLSEIAQYGRGELGHLDLALELGPEPLERDRVLGVEIGETDDLDRRGGVVERPPQIGGEGVIRLPVEAELGHRPGLVPARIVVVARGRVQPELHVVVGSDPLGGIDHAPLEGGVDVGGRREDRGAADLGHDLAPEAGNAHLEALEIADGVDLPPEPARHLRGDRRPGARHQVERPVRFLPELQAIALVV